MANESLLCFGRVTHVDVGLEGVMLCFCDPFFSTLSCSQLQLILGCDIDAFGEKSSKGWHGLDTGVGCPLGSHQPQDHQDSGLSLNPC